MNDLHALALMSNNDVLHLHTQGAADPSIFTMTTVVTPPASVCTLGQTAFISIAIHIIQKNWSSTLAKVCRREGNGRTWVTQLATDHPEKINHIDYQ